MMYLLVENIICPLLKNRVEPARYVFEREEERTMSFLNDLIKPLV